MAFMRNSKEPIMLISRQNNRNLMSSPTRAQTHAGSKLIAALDAMDLRDRGACADDSEVEVLSPTKVTRKLKPKLAPIARNIAIHPFFQKKSQVQLLERSEPAAGTSKTGNPKPATSLPAILPMPKAPPKQGDVPQKTTRNKSASSSKENTPAARCPKYTYKDYSSPRPCVVYTQHEEETDDLVGSLARGPLAFDMEWRVFFTNPRSTRPVTERRTAVVQVADTRGLILVVQVYHMSRFPKSLIDLLENPDIPKLGVNILNDGRKLFRDYGILAQNLVELGAVAARAESDGAAPRGRTMVSLAKLVEKYCGKTLEKGKERTGNWEAELSVLSPMVEYAANDVHSTTMVLARLEELAATNANIPANPTRTSVLAGIHGANVKREDCPLVPAEEEPKGEMRPQYIRAYRCWHDRGMSLEKMGIELRVDKAGGATAPGLKRGTVISYIIGALQADDKLPFEMSRLRELVQMDLGSWGRHRQWLLGKWAQA